MDWTLGQLHISSHGPGPHDTSSASRLAGLASTTACSFILTTKNTTRDIRCRWFVRSRITFHSQNQPQSPPSKTRQIPPSRHHHPDSTMKTNPAKLISKALPRTPNHNAVSHSLDIKYNCPLLTPCRFTLARTPATGPLPTWRSPKGTSLAPPHPQLRSSSVRLGSRPWISWRFVFGLGCVFCTFELLSNYAVSA